MTLTPLESDCLARLGVSARAIETHNQKHAAKTAGLEGKTMTTTEMRILTVRQPWAWAIVHGSKDVENRVRNIAGDYRGPVAIHAGAVYDRAADDHPEIRRMAEARGVRSMREYLIPYGQRGYRHIGGVVDLIAVHDASLCTTWGLIDSSWCSPWAEPDAKHLVLANQRPLPTPIPYRGALGLRRLDDETTARILAQMEVPHAV